MKQKPGEKAAVVFFGAKNHDPDRLDAKESNGRGVRDVSYREEGEGGGEESEKLNQSKDADDTEEGSEERIVFTKTEAVWSRAFLLSRLALGSFNLISFCLKIPLIILIIRMVVELAKAKAVEQSVTTIEPPYDDELPVNNATGTDPEEAKSQRRAFIIQILVLLVMYVGMLLVHVLCVFYFWLNKGLFHLCIYLPLVGMWLFLAVPSGFVQSWSWTWTNVMFVVLQAVIHGNDLFGTPSKTEFRLVRISIWMDVVTFILSCLFIIFAKRLDKYLKSERVMDLILLRHNK